MPSLYLKGLKPSSLRPPLISDGVGSRIEDEFKKAAEGLIDSEEARESSKVIKRRISEDKRFLSLYILALLLDKLRIVQGKYKYPDKGHPTSMWAKRERCSVCILECIIELVTASKNPALLKQLEGVLALKDDFYETIRDKVAIVEYLIKKKTFDLNPSIVTRIIACSSSNL